MEPSRGEAFDPDEQFEHTADSIQRLATVACEIVRVLHEQDERRDDRSSADRWGDAPQDVQPMDGVGRSGDHGPMTYPSLAPRRPRTVHVGIGLLALVALALPASALAAPTSNDSAPAPRDVVQGAPGDADIAISLRASGRSKPVFITSAQDGSGRMFIVEQTGKIKILKDGAVRDVSFLNLKGQVSGGFEQGLLGLAFHPNFATNRKLYVNYTNLKGNTRIVEYRASSSNPNVVDTSTKRTILKINQPYPNHNGGMLAFGPDGYLYIGMGDGGDTGDPGNRAQNKDSLLGKMLRININGSMSNKNYLIPAGNPYNGVAGANEIWQIGLRNPWRYSFDRANGDLWIGDVGQFDWEEIDRADSTGSGPGRGINWGWRHLEGTHCYNPSSGCATSGKTMPIHEYGHNAGRCSVTGGYVYRGSGIPVLVGGYVFGDYCTGEIWVVDASASAPASKTLLLDTNLLISSFGENASGELYVVDRGGRVYAIVQG